MLHPQEGHSKTERPYCKDYQYSKQT